MIKSFKRRTERGGVRGEKECVCEHLNGAGEVSRFDQQVEKETGTV